MDHDAARAEFQVDDTGFLRKSFQLCDINADGYLTNEENKKCRETSREMLIEKVR